MSEYIQYISFTTHQPQTVYDNVSGEKSALYWDANGNLAQMIGCKQDAVRFRLLLAMVVYIMLVRTNISMRTYAMIR